MHAYLPRAYAAALAYYLSAPTVNSIDTSRYGGAIGDDIFIQASDGFMFTSVHVSIFNASGSLLEQGDAELQLDAVHDYVYKATVANAAVPGTKILVTVRDKPRNITVEEKVL